MGRRGVLATVGVCVSGGFAGCSGLIGQPDPEDFERCPQLIIQRSELPDLGRREVDTALKDGEYESEDTLYLPYLIDPEKSYIEVGSTEYYQATVTQRTSTSILELDQTIPSHSVEALLITNNTDEQLSINIQIKWLTEPEPVVKTSQTMVPDETTDTPAFSRRFGDYCVSIETASWQRSVEWVERESEALFSGLSITAGSLKPEPRPVFDTINCRDVWE